MNVREGRADGMAFASLDGPRSPLTFEVVTAKPERIIDLRFGIR
jgi:hypothetical protein